MDSAQKYLEQLMAQAPRRELSWWLMSERTGTAESRRAKLEATLRFFGRDQDLPDIGSRLAAQPQIADLSPELCGVFDQTARDLEEYLPGSEIGQYRRTVFGLLPLSAVDAFCLKRTHWGEELDGYVVVMNEGLFICAQLLSKAFLLDNLGGDLLPYKRPGVDAYRLAISYFLAPSAKHANSVFFDDVPPDVEGALAAAQMNMTVLLLQFVLLHELGHVVHEDHRLMEQYQFHVASDPSQPRVEATQAFWAAEYAADAYALERILQKVATPASRWANFVAIRAFFHWLGGVERITGRPICPLHPPPRLRGEALRELMNTTPLDASMAAAVDKSMSILKSWDSKA